MSDPPFGTEEIGISSPDAPVHVKIIASLQN